MAKLTTFKTICQYTKVALFTTYILGGCSNFIILTTFIVVQMITV